MIDLTDYGYVEHSIFFVDPGGVAEGSLGGPADYIDRPGLRYGVRYTLRPLPSAKEARLFQSMLERGLREDVAYKWPLDFKPLVTGSSTYDGSPWPKVNGTNPPGASLAVKNLLPGFVFKAGQVISLVQGALGYVHRVTTEAIVDGSGHATLSLFPWTRLTFADGDRVEVEDPHIRGRLSWDGSTQPAYGSRPFSFTITERK